MLLLLLLLLLLLFVLFEAIDPSSKRDFDSHRLRYTPADNAKWHVPGTSKAI